MGDKHTLFFMRAEHCNIYEQQTLPVVALAGLDN